MIHLNCLFDYQLTGQANNAVWSKDGQFVLIAKDNGEIAIVQISSGQTLFSQSGFSEGLSAIAWANNSSCFAVGDDNSIKIVKVNPIQLLHEIPLTGKDINKGIVSLTWSTDDSKLCAGMWHDSTIGVWDAQNGDYLFTLGAHPGNANSRGIPWNLKFSSNTALLASAASDGTTLIWDLQEKIAISVYDPYKNEHNNWREFSCQCWDVAWHPQQNNIAVSFTESHLLDQDEYEGKAGIIAWNQGIGESIFNYSTHSSRIRTLSYIDNGNLILFGDDAGYISILNASTGQKLGSQKCHTDMIQTINCCNQTSLVVSASSDNTVKIWQILNQ